MESIDSTKHSDSTLEFFFRKILKGQALEIDINNAYDLLNNLSVNVDVLKPKIRTVLPFLLIHFIKSWPGWQKSSAYFKKEITFEKWFQKFTEYISFKLNFILRSELENICDDIEHLSFDSPILFGIDNSTQTDQTDTGVETSIAPYSIEIKAPPRFLNTIVFCDGINNDVILKEYKTNVKWSEKLTFRQLINWPNVEIEFNSKDLHFKRCNVHDFQRFLAVGTYKLPLKKPTESCIEEVDIIDKNISRKSYSLNILKEYCNLYINVFKNNYKLFNWSDDDLKEVEVILEDLLLDIIDINQNSIATNTTVLFNIGNSTYVRNKGVRTSGESICLTDLVTPKILLSFISFTAFKDSDSAEPFPSLKIENKRRHQLIDILPTISYRCTYCENVFSNDTDIWLHLKGIHSMELPVMCFRCEQQFTIPTLTQHRWRHQCKLGITNSKEKT